MQFTQSERIWVTYIFSMDSEISGQNSLTMLSSLRNAKIFNSGIGSSKRAMTPAETIQRNFINITIAT